MPSIVSDRVVFPSHDNYAPCRRIGRPGCPQLSMTQHVIGVTTNKPLVHAWGVLDALNCSCMSLFYFITSLFADSLDSLFY